MVLLGTSVAATGRLGFCLNKKFNSNPRVAGNGEVGEGGFGGGDGRSLPPSINPFKSKIAEKNYLFINQTVF